MQWSKLRSTVRALICEELRQRIDFHATSYRNSHDEAEKVWITIDGETILTASWYHHQWHGWPRDNKGRLDHQSKFPGGIDKAKDEVHLPQEVGDVLRAYVDMPIDVAIESSNPLMRALSIIDRRVGKRRLEAIKISENDHSLVREFYRLRRESVNQP